MKATGDCCVPAKQAPQAVRWLVTVAVDVGSGVCTLILCIPLFGLIESPASVVFDDIGNVLTLVDVCWVMTITLVQLWCTRGCKGRDGHKAEGLLSKHCYAVEASDWMLKSEACC